jgi:glycerol-3-phosphate dehydrogenase (NAD(P)+)
MAWSSVLKNVYAILLGAADALGLGDNVRGYLITVAIREMRAIVRQLGGSGETCLSLSGLADLVTTATSPGSHHHELGGQLARGETGTLSGEGIHTLEMIRQRGMFDGSAYPLFNLVESLVTHPGDTEARITGFIAAQFRQPGPGAAGTPG